MPALALVVMLRIYNPPKVGGSMMRRDMTPEQQQRRGRTATGSIAASVIVSSGLFGLAYDADIQRKEALLVNPITDSYTYQPPWRRMVEPELIAASQEAPPFPVKQIEKTTTVEFLLISFPVIIVLLSAVVVQQTRKNFRQGRMSNDMAKTKGNDVSVPMPLDPNTEPKAWNVPLRSVQLLKTNPADLTFLPRKNDIFAVASGVALTLGLQAGGEIPTDGSIDLSEMKILLPFCYGTALATIYDALSVAISIKTARIQSSFAVVVTGSTRGVGRALVREFLKRGDRVLVTSRNQEAVDKTIAQLKEDFPERKIVGMAADVSNGVEVNRLADFAVEQFGEIDLWINNAGTISSRKEKLTDLSQAEITNTVTTNLVGSLLCTQVALKVMSKQGHGHVFNMDGAGATGQSTPLYAPYGSTKAALVQLTKTLCEENVDVGVGVHLLSPGMVITDLLLTGATDQNLQAFNILAELPEVPTT